MSRRPALVVLAGAVMLVASCGSTSSPAPSGSPIVGSQAPQGSSAFSGVHRAYTAPVLDGGRPLTFFMGAEY